MIPPETQYTKVNGSWVGYQIVGDGPVDVCYVTGMASNIETMWDWPDFKRVLEHFASWGRLIVFDARGTGVSDGLPVAQDQAWEEVTHDVRAVLDAASSERAAIFGQLDGGLAAILFAATYPERTSSLVLWNGYARSMMGDDYPFGWSKDLRSSLFEMYEAFWGRGEMVPLIDPSRTQDTAYCRAEARFMRTASSPQRFLASMTYRIDLDARSALPAVRVPTLVLQSANAFIPTELGKYVADRIPDAKFVEIASPDVNIFAMADADLYLDEIEEFVTGSRRAATTDRVLATILFTDIVGSTEAASALGDRRWKETLAGHDRVAREQIDRFKGRLVNTMGDGLLATFDGPGRAIRCAISLGKALESSGIKIRAGLHTGEIELRDEKDIGGIAVHIASRVMGEAGPGEVVCSRTVKDLVAGSEFMFADRGMCALKGVPGEWRLYAVAS